MSGRRPVLDTAFIRLRRHEQDLSVRHVADALGLSEAGWRHLEAGRNPDGLHLGQLGALATLLAVDVTDLLAEADADPLAEQPADPGGPPDDVLVRRIGAALLTAGRTVSIGMLADSFGVPTDQVTAAVEVLTNRLAPAGMVVSVRKNGVTVVPDSHSLRDGGVQALLRTGDARHGLPAAPARLLHRLARGVPMKQTPSRDDRARLSVLLRGGWAVPGDGAAAGPAAITLHPDVRFSLGLDEGFTCAAATATTQHAPRGRRPLPWLTDTDSDTNDDEIDAEAP